MGPTIDPPPLQTEFHPRLIGLTGTPEACAVAARAFRVYHHTTGEAKDYLVDHSIITYLLGACHKLFSPLLLLTAVFLHTCDRPGWRFRDVLRQECHRRGHGCSRERAREAMEPNQGGVANTCGVRSLACPCHHCSQQGDAQPRVHQRRHAWPLQSCVVGCSSDVVQRQRQQHGVGHVVLEQAGARQHSQAPDGYARRPAHVARVNGPSQGGLCHKRTHSRRVPLSTSVVTVLRRVAFALVL